MPGWVALFRWEIQLYLPYKYNCDLNTEQMKYYTYAYLREDGTPYYIGKGKGNKAFQSSRHNVKVPPRNRILFLKTNITEMNAFKHEIYMIAVLGRVDLGTGILRNKTDGGEGASGYKHSDEAKQKISQANTGRVWDDLSKKKFSNKCKGRKPTPMSQEKREKLSKLKKGVKRPQHVVEKMMKTRQENQSFIGSNNPNAKTFVFVSPTGEKYVVKGKFKNFCQTKNLSHWGLRNFKKTGIMTPSCNGWRVFCDD